MQPAPDLDPSHNGSWTSNFMMKSPIRLIEMVLRKNPKLALELENAEQHEHAKVGLVEILRALESCVATARFNIERIQMQLDYLKGADAAFSLYQIFKSTGRPLHLIANELAGACLLQSAAPGVLKLAQQELDSAQKKLADFMSENKNILKEAEDETAAQDAEFRRHQAEIAAEQQAAFERRQQKDASEHQKLQVRHGLA
jgi:hypothetical protein